MLSLLAPWFLAGLGALSVPVLVHLIQKERKESIPFPSLMFIENVPYQAVRRQRIRHWLLFLLRCLAIVLIVMAFARPFFASHNASAAAVLPNAGRDIVIALDRSYSMEYGDRWERAVKAAKDVVGRMGDGDRAVVVYFAGTASVAGDLTHDRTALISAIDSARPTDGVTRYGAALRLVQNVFGDTAQPRREVVLISDYQRSGWSERELPTLPAGTVLTQIDVGNKATTNIVVTNVDIHYDTSAGHERVSVQAHIANRGATAISKRPLIFDLNGRQMQTRLVDCPANATATVDFDEVPTPPGISRGFIRAGPDALAADNSFYFVVTREPSLPVLLVQYPGADVKAGMFIDVALGISQHISFHVKPVQAGKFSADELRRASLIILNGAPVPGGEIGRRLVDYVKSGGGLLVLLGSQSRPNEWPTSADELLPRPIAPVVDRVVDRGATLEFIDRGHAVFEPFNASHSGDFSAARFLRYWAIKPAVTDKQLARFDDGHVALMERRLGAGRVLVWSSDLDGVWNDFPLQPVFLPLLHQIAKYASGYQEGHRWETVGEMLSIPSLFGENTRNSDSDREHEDISGAQYVAISPSGVQTRFNSKTSSQPSTLELTEQGFYDIERTGGAGDSARTVAVNVDLTESDLTPLDTGLLATAVSPLTAMQRKAHVMGDITPSDLEHRQNIWWYLLVVALLFLGAETLLSNRLSRAAH